MPLVRFDAAKISISPEPTKYFFDYFQTFFIYSALDAENTTHYLGNKKTKETMTAIYKLGARGEGVKDIQVALRVAGYNDITVDGYYWYKTQAAVKDFQQSRGIGNDGVVGPVTMAKLKEVMAMGTKDSGKNAGISITNGYIYQHVTRCANRPIQYIAIHYTAGSRSTKGQAMQARNVFLQRSASADFVVDDGTIVQVNPDLRNYYCWSVGDAKNKWTGGGRLYGKAVNKNTVSIEICSTLRSGTTAQQPNHEGWSLSDAAVEQARRLVRHLMNLYGIPKERVIRHYDVSGKLCPGIPGWNDGPLFDTRGRQTSGKSDSRKWEAFVASL